MGEEALQPAIINNSLSTLDNETLLRVLREIKKSLGWSVIYLKGISPTYCTHKIKMEEKFKLVVQPQRRLNPNMKK